MKVLTKYIINLRIYFRSL